MFWLLRLLLFLFLLLLSCRRICVRWRGNWLLHVRSSISIKLPARITRLLGSVAMGVGPRSNPFATSMVFLLFMYLYYIFLFFPCSYILISFILKSNEASVSISPAFKILPSLIASGKPSLNSRLQYLYLPVPKLISPVTQRQFEYHGTTVFRAPPPLIRHFVSQYQYYQYHVSSQTISIGMPIALLLLLPERFPSRH